MRTIQLIQYMRPHGTREPVTTNVSDEAGAKYDELRKLGLCLTAELVPGPLVNVCISNDKAGFDFDQILHSNDHTLQAEIETMLLRFDEAEYRKQLVDWESEEP